MAEERPCPTCGDFDLTLTVDEPIEGWNELACKTCRRVLEIGRRGVGPLVDPLWIDRKHTQSRIKQLEAALRGILDVGDASSGSDWGDLTLSRDIARAALAQSSPPKATDCTCPVGMHSIGCHNR